MKQLNIHMAYRQEVGDRKVQQDAVAVSDEKLYRRCGLLAVLSDGMGGMASGERFSDVVVTEMLRAFENADPALPLCERLEAIYRPARTEALKLRTEEKLDGGATVAAVLMHKNQCAFLSAGDSRIYLWRNGGLIQLNREQNLGVLLDERAAMGQIPWEEAHNNLHRDSLTNHVCEPGEQVCDRNDRPFPLCPGDKIALLSDGVFRTLDEAGISKRIALPGTQGVDAICQAVLREGKSPLDNYSVLLLAISGSCGIK